VKIKALKHEEYGHFELSDHVWQAVSGVNWRIPTFVSVVFSCVTTL
jgi:hypothetical protein